MKNVTTVYAVIACALLAACKKTKAESQPDPTKEAAKPAEPAPPAVLADKKLAQVGVTASLPGDALIDEHKMDSGGIQATISFNGMPNFFISNVDDGSDSLDTTIKHAEAKDWKLQDKAPDGGTWKLEWTKPDLVDASKLTYNVAVRSKVGDKAYDCGSNGLGESQAITLLKICASLK